MITEIILSPGLYNILTLFWDKGGGGAQKGPPTSFSPVISENVGISLKNILTFGFNSFPTLAQNFKFVASASP